MAFELQWIGFPQADGPLRYAEVPWDTETFGFPVFEIRIGPDFSAENNQALTSLLARLSEPRPSLIVCKVPLAAAAGIGARLARHDFYPVETLVELHRSLARFQPIVSRMPDSLRLRRAEPSEQPAIEELARGSFQADRFHCDPFIPESKADQRFADWIKRAFEQGDPVYAFEDSSESQLLGFYHVKESAASEKKVDLSLAALARTHQKSGLGLLMYQQVLLDCQARGFALAETRVTVSNVDVLNLFVRLGFALRNPTVTFHRHAGAEAETPNTKLQAPEKLQTPSSKPKP
jgi:hypothetical protein